MGKIKSFFNFDNIGGKLKKFAKRLCWISIIVVWVLSAIMFLVGFGMAVDTDEEGIVFMLVALVYALLYPFLIWVSCWATYAFGEMVEKQTAIEKLLTTHLPAISGIKEETEEPKIISWQCPKCKNINPLENKFCINCGCPKE